MTLVKQMKQNQYVLYELVRKSVKTQYRNSFLGMLWSVLNPLLNMCVMWLVFSQFFGRNDPLFPVYLLCGNIMFSYLSAATNGALPSIVNNRGLLTRMKIDTHLFPLSANFAALVNFFFSFTALFVIVLGFQIFGGYQLLSFRLLLIPTMLPAMILFQFGISLILSSVYVFARDIKYLYSVFMTLWMYITPIFYKINAIASNSIAYTIIKLNPMYHFVRFFRWCVYGFVDVGSYSPNWHSLAMLYLVGIGSVLLGYLIYRPLKKHFMMNI